MAREPVSATPRLSITKARRKAVLSRYGGLCGMCFKPLGEKWVADHIIPLELSGPDDLNNLWPLCEPCNRLKTSKDLKAIAKVRRLLKKAQKKPPRPNPEPEAPD